MYTMGIVGRWFFSVLLIIQYYLFWILVIIINDREKCV